MCNGRLTHPPTSSPQGAAEGEDVVLLKGGGFRRRRQRGPGGDVGQVETSQYVELSLKDEADPSFPCCFVRPSKLEVSLPDIDYIEIPAPWWDAEADKSLLIGVHKHGEAVVAPRSILICATLDTTFASSPVCLAHATEPPPPPFHPESRFIEQVDSVTLITR